MEDLTAREQRLRRREQTILEQEQRDRLREIELEQHANLRRERERIDREIEELEMERSHMGTGAEASSEDRQMSRDRDYFEPTSDLQEYGSLYLDTEDIQPSFLDEDRSLGEFAHDNVFEQQEESLTGDFLIESKGARGRADVEEEGINTVGQLRQRLSTTELSLTLKDKQSKAAQSLRNETDEQSSHPPPSIIKRKVAYRDERRPDKSLLETHRTQQLRHRAEFDEKFPLRQSSKEAASKKSIRAEADSRCHTLKTNSVEEEERQLEERIRALSLQADKMAQKSRQKINEENDLKQRMRMFEEKEKRFIEQMKRREKIEKMRLAQERLERIVKQQVEEEKEQKHRLDLLHMKRMKMLEKLEEKDRMPILASTEDEIHRIRNPEIKYNPYDTDETTLLKPIDGSDRSRIEEMKYNPYPIDETKLPVFEIGVNRTTADERTPISNLIDTTQSVRKADTKQKEEDTLRIGNINLNEIQMKQETPNIIEENIRHEKENSDLQKTAQDLLKQKE